MRIQLTQMLFCALFLLPLASAWCASSSVTITSQPTVSSNPGLTGEQLTYMAAATDASGGTITYTWQFGDGTVQNTHATSITHRYTVPGFYTVIVAISGSTGGIVGNPFNLTINDPATKPPVGSGVDTDGDGFSDLYEIQMGTDPNDPKSTPLGGTSIASGGVYKMTISKASIKLHFDKKGANEIKMSGTIVGPQGFSVANQPFVVSVAGVAVPFKLDKNGKGALGKSKISIATKGKTVQAASVRDGVIVGPGVTEYKWTADLKQPDPKENIDPQPYPFQPPAPAPQAPDMSSFLDFLTALEFWGFIDEDIGIKTSGGLLGNFLDLPCCFECPFCFFEELLEMDYTAKHGKSGSAVIPKFK